MFRAAVLSLVLTLLGGANTALLCQAWCEPQAAAAAGCHDHDSSPTAGLTAADGCDELAPNVPALARDDGGRGPLAPDALLATDSPLHLAPPTPSSGSEYERRNASFDRCPLVTSLRI